MKAPSPASKVSSLRPQLPGAKRSLWRSRMSTPEAPCPVIFSESSAQRSEKCWRVEGGCDRRVLRVRARVELVRGLVVPGEQVEVVGDVVTSRARIEVAGLAIQIEIGVGGIADRVVQAQLLARARHDVRRVRSRRRLDAAVASHERDLVVRIERGVWVRAGERVGVRVGEDADPVGRLVVDRAEVHHGALVDLDRHLRPGLVQVVVGEDLARRRPGKARQVGAGTTTGLGAQGLRAEQKAALHWRRALGAAAGLTPRRRRQQAGCSG